MKLYTVDETADELRVKVSTIRAWIFQNRLPVVRLGKRVLIKESTIENIKENGLDNGQGKN